MAEQSLLITPCKMFMQSVNRSNWPNSVTTCSAWKWPNLLAGLSRGQVRIGRSALPVALCDATCGHCRAQSRSDWAQECHKGFLFSFFYYFFFKSRSFCCSWFSFSLPPFNFLLPVPSQRVCGSVQHVTLTGTPPISLSAASLCWVVWVVSPKRRHPAVFCSSGGNLREVPGAEGCPVAPARRRSGGHGRPWRAAGPGLPKPPARSCCRCLFLPLNYAPRLWKDSSYLFQQTKQQVFWRVYQANCTWQKVITHAIKCRSNWVIRG